MMFLREMGPQLNLPIYVTKGSMPFQCSTYFPKILVKTHAKFNLPSLMKFMTDFLPIYHPISFHSILFGLIYKHGQKLQKKCISKYCS